MNSVIALATAKGYSYDILKGKIPDSEYLTDIIFIKLQDSCIQQVADNVYIVKGYRPGQNYPESHLWSVTVVVEGGLYHCFAFTKVDGGELELSQFRSAHKFFRNMGLKPEYVRGKHILKKKLTQSDESV